MKTRMKDFGRNASFFNRFQYVSSHKTKVPLILMFEGTRQRCLTTFLQKPLGTADCLRHHWVLQRLRCARYHRGRLVEVADAASFFGFSLGDAALMSNVRSNLDGILFGVNSMQHL